MNANGQGAKAAPPSKSKQGGEARQFKSNLPKAGGKGGGLPGMDGPGGAAVVCPWEDFGDMELSELAAFGIV